jgi:16S rRNA A1518/A1519 N6-dimethyltransferase RsmA/KsgA/DIM1 with predicted DNA glycosylase/AP lyase activity
MIDILNDRTNNGDFHVENTQFKINNIDVLKYEPGFETYDVIANIPYYITSPILRHFLYDVENKPEHMVILMQDDV